MKYFQTFENTYYNPEYILRKAMAKGDLEKIKDVWPEFEKTATNIGLQVYMYCNHAVKSNHFHILEYFLDHPALDISEDNYNLFRIGCLYGSTECVEILLDKYPEIKQNQKALYNGFEYAIEKTNVLILRMFAVMPEIDMSHGSDFIARTIDVCKDKELIKLLLKRDDFNVKVASQYMMPYAAKYRWDEVLLLFLDHPDVIKPTPDILNPYYGAYGGWVSIEKFVNHPNFKPDDQTVAYLMFSCINPKAKKDELLKKVLEFENADPSSGGDYNLLLATLNQYSRNIDAFKIIVNDKKIDNHHLINFFIQNNISLRYLEIYSDTIDKDMIKNIQQLQQKYSLF
jgi:hypothetical protein